MCGDPVFGQDVLPCAASGRAIVAVDADPSRGLRHLEDAVTSLGTHEHLLPGLFPELAAPTRPADRRWPHVVWLTRSPVRRRQGAPQPRQDAMYADRPGGFRGRRCHTPWLLTRVATAMLHQTAVIILIKRPHGLVHRSLGQEDGLTPGAVRATVPRADDHGVDASGLAGATVMGAPRRRRARGVIRGQPGDADHRGRQSVAARRRPSPRSRAPGRACRCPSAGVGRGHSPSTARWLPERWQRRGR